MPRRVHLLTVVLGCAGAICAGCATPPLNPQPDVAAASQSIYRVATPDILIIEATGSGKQVVSGEHLVRPDGTVLLSVYGSSDVAGKTLDEVKQAVERNLSEYQTNLEVRVDVAAYSKQFVEIILDGGGFGETIERLPITGDPTIKDAISRIEGLSPVTKQIWIARPGSPSNTSWQEVTSTNWQLLPGDRLFITTAHNISFGPGETRQLKHGRGVMGGFNEF